MRGVNIGKIFMNESWANHEWTWYNTLIKILKLRFICLVFIYGVQFFFTQHETLSYTCIPTISFSREFLSYSNLFSSSKNYFQFMSIQWWFLEFNCDCLDFPIHCCQQFLVLCTNATLVRLVVWFSCMNSSIRKTFETSNFHVHGSNARLNCLSGSPSQIINSESNKKRVFVLTKKCVTCAIFRWMCCVNI